MSKHFKPKEFACKHCGHMIDIAPELYAGLEALRYHIPTCRIRIVSGYRCHTYNASLPGAAKNSQHMLGRAADVVVELPSSSETGDTVWAQLDPGTVAEVANKMVPEFNRGGIGRYRNFTHVDVRGCYGQPRARWKGK